MAVRHGHSEPPRTDNPFRMPPEMDLVWMYKPDDQKKTKALYSYLEQRERKKIDFFGQIVKGRRYCLASFPGQCYREWHEYAQRYGGACGSIACVFLGGRNFGEHSKNEEDNGRCYCHAMYGKEEDWGCQWFEQWTANIEEAVEDGQRLAVFVSHGKKKSFSQNLVDWSDLPSRRDPVEGVGPSQKAEVAWLRKKGYRFECFDMAEWDAFVDDHLQLERSKSIWEKPTAASRYAATRTLRDHELPMAPAPPALQRKLSDLRKKVLDAERPDDTFLTTIATKPAIGVVEPLRMEERDLRQYVQKKREVFLVQMALDVKKSEIVRLDEKARLKEEALGKSQQMLDDDTRKFEEFLQERYTRAQKTTKEAEHHMKEKQAKIQKIKGIKQNIAGLQSEIGKFREVREECARYKAFLDQLTPLEWKEQQRDIKQNRKKERRQEWITKRMASILEDLDKERHQIEKNIANEEPKERKFGRKKNVGEDEQAQKEKEKQKRLKQLERRKVEEERRIADRYEEISSEEEPELYFKEPRQLMDTFTELEEKNLFLIQSSQETEQMLDELQTNFEHNRKEMSTKVRQLNETIRNIQANTAEQQRQYEQLQRSLAEKAGTEAQDKKLQELHQKVHDVYVKCGLTDEHDPDILQMLGSIESKLEELIHGLDEAFQDNDDLVMRLEKEKDKERRERVRVLRLKEQDENREERLKNSLLRSQLPVFKKSGKQVMYRSPPLHKEKKVVKDFSDDEKHAHDHQVFGMYIDRRTNDLHTGAPVIEDPRARAAARLAVSTLNSTAGGVGGSHTLSSTGEAGAALRGVLLEDTTLENGTLALATGDLPVSDDA